MKKITTCICAGMLAALVLCSGCTKDEDTSGAATQTEETTKTEEAVSSIETWQNEYVSFEYNTDLMSVSENGSGMEYVVSVMGKNAESIVPHVDLIGLDTAGIGDQMTAEMFEELATNAVTEYYGNADPLDISVTGTEISTDNPACRTASTVLTVGPTDDSPTVYAQADLQYNETYGVMAIALLDDEIGSENAVPFLKVMESVTLK